jgi:hypothetical protein
MQPLVAFGVGVVGALAPEIVRLYSLRNQHGASLSSFYFAVSFLFAALGGFVAMILPATTLWGAFYAGISTPVVISTALKKGLDHRDSETRYRARNESQGPRTPANLLKFVRAL